jgi:myo-inositol 2-dehydrogenase/D-chiro-inositol 1-dehydrogenase
VTIHAAIVGLGRWGRRLVDSVQDGTVAPCPSLRFVRGWTRTAERAREFAAARGFELARDFEALLDDEAIDAIVLATPHSQHAEQVIACARAGKAVYVEKPLALTREEALRAARACSKAGIVLAVGHNRRFLPAMRALFEMAAAGELGQLLHVEGNFSGPFGFDYDNTAWRASENEAPGGGLTLMGVHILDAMIALMGPVASLSATSLRQVLQIELDDTSAATLRFANNASGYVSTLTATPRLWRLQLFGTKAWAHVLDHEILEVCKLGDTVKRRTFPREDSERIALDHFARAVRGDAPFPVALSDVLNGIAAVEAFVDSARRDGKVTALPPEDALCFH